MDLARLQTAEHEHSGARVLSGDELVWLSLQCDAWPWPMDVLAQAPVLTPGDAWRAEWGAQFWS